MKATWNPGCGADGPRGLAFDAAHDFVVVACTDHVQVLDAGHDGAPLGRLDTGAGVDNIDFVGGRVYAAAGKAAQLTVAAVDDEGPARGRRDGRHLRGGAQRGRRRERQRLRRRLARARGSWSSRPWCRSRSSGLRSSVRAARLRDPTIRPRWPAGQIRVTGGPAAARVAHPRQGLDAARLRVLTERRGRPQRHGIAQRFFGPARVTERIEAKAAELEGGDRGPGIAPERSTQAVEAPRGVLKASLGAGPLRIVEEILRVHAAAEGRPGHGRARGRRGCLRCAGRLLVRRVGGDPGTADAGSGADHCSPAVSDRVSPDGELTSTAPRSTRTATRPAGVRSTQKCVPTTRTAYGPAPTTKVRPSTCVASTSTPPRSMSSRMAEGRALVRRRRVPPASTTREPSLSEMLVPSVDDGASMTAPSSGSPALEASSLAPPCSRTHDDPVTSTSTAAVATTAAAPTHHHAAVRSAASLRAGADDFVLALEPRLRHGRRDVTRVEGAHGVAPRPARRCSARSPASSRRLAVASEISIVSATSWSVSPSTRWRTSAMRSPAGNRSSSS